VESLDWPHNNLAQALAETGLVGFVPYVMTHILLLGAFWQLRRLHDSGSLVWKYFFYMFLAYWITGLTESSGFDYLNIPYAFVIAVCYKYGLTGFDSVPPAEVQVPEAASSAPTRIFSPAFLR